MVSSENIWKIITNLQQMKWMRLDSMTKLEMSSRFSNAPKNSKRYQILFDLLQSTKELGNVVELLDIMLSVTEGKQKFEIVVVEIGCAQ